jgi:hypothetical protein
VSVVLLDYFFHVNCVFQLYLFLYANSEDVDFNFTMVIKGFSAKRLTCINISRVLVR